MTAASAARDCATEILAAMARHGADVAALGASMGPALRRLCQVPNLEALGAPRQGNNVDTSYYLYFDGRLSILLYRVPKGAAIPPHDHGIWETVTAYRGRLRHIVYRRVDDGARPGRAELRAIDDRVLERGDFALVAPPDDIHGFTALDDDTFGITAVAAAYKAERHYYDIAAGTYAIRAQRNAR